MRPGAEDHTHADSKTNRTNHQEMPERCHRSRTARNVRVTPAITAQGCPPDLP